MLSCESVCLVDIEVGVIREGCWAHAAGSVGDAVVGVCVDIVQNLSDGDSSGFCCFGLLGYNDIEGNKECVVYRSSIVE